MYKISNQSKMVIFFLGEMRWNASCERAEKMLLKDISNIIVVQVFTKIDSIASAYKIESSQSIFGTC